MKSFDQLQLETNALHLDFLLTDLSAASTFLDIAETTQNTTTRARNIENASVAHDAVKRFFPRTSMSIQQNKQVRDKLELLRLRIKSFGPLGRVEE